MTEVFIITYTDFEENGIYSLKFYPTIEIAEGVRKELEETEAHIVDSTRKYFVERLTLAQAED